MLDLSNIRDGLVQFVPNGEAITRIIPLTTGFSNETYLLEGLDAILRMPPSAGAMLDGHDVVAQARIYSELNSLEHGPVVPKIISICEDASVVGMPFFVMEKVHGQSIDDFKMQPWFVEGTDELRREVCCSWVSAFAGLSRLRPLEILGNEVSPEADARIWQQFSRKADCPVLVAMFDRLLSHPAPRSGPPAIVHGDTKLSNLMWHDGQLSAMLDWEMALNGEPLADLGYMLYAFESEHHAATRAQKLPGMLTREEVISLWSQVSGRSADGVFWHEIAQVGKITAIIAEGANMHVTGRSADPKLEIFQQSLAYYLGVMESMLDDGNF